MALFDCTVDDVGAGFGGRLTVLAVGFAWSPSSCQLLAAVRAAGLAELGVAVRTLDGDGALAFASKNGILSGAGGVKIYDEGREVCFRRAEAGLTYTIVSALRSSQVRDLVQRVLDAKKSNTIAQLDF